MTNTPQDLVTKWRESATSAKKYATTEHENGHAMAELRCANELEAALAAQVRSNQPQDLEQGGTKRQAMKLSERLSIHAQDVYLASRPDNDLVIGAHQMADLADALREAAAALSERASKPEPDAICKCGWGDKEHLREECTPAISEQAPSEAVAITRHDAGFEPGPLFDPGAWDRLRALPRGTKLYTSPQPRGVPDGMALVPVDYQSVFGNTCWRCHPKLCRCPLPGDRVEAMKGEIYLLDQALQREKRRARMVAADLADLAQAMLSVKQSRIDSGGLDNLPSDLFHLAEKASEYLLAARPQPRGVGVAALESLAQSWQDKAAESWGETPAHAAMQTCCDELRALIAAAPAREAKE